MKGTLHLTYGIATGIGIGLCLKEEPSFAALAAVSCIAGSLFPDIDSPTSQIGKRTFGVSKIIKSVFGHRGFFHTPLFLILIWFFYYLYAKGFDPALYSFWFMTGFSIGIVCHLIQDLLTRGGIKLFYPLSGISFHLTNLKSSSEVHVFFTVLLSVATLYGLMRIPFPINF